MFLSANRCHADAGLPTTAKMTPLHCEHFAPYRVAVRYQSMPVVLDLVNPIGAGHGCHRPARLRPRGTIDLSRNGPIASHSLRRRATSLRIALSCASNLLRFFFCSGETSRVGQRIPDAGNFAIDFIQLIAQGFTTVGFDAFRGQGGVPPSTLR
jgi:hypothetical protein